MKKYLPLLLAVALIGLAFVLVVLNQVEMQRQAIASGNQTRVNRCMMAIDWFQESYGFLPFKSIPDPLRFCRTWKRCIAKYFGYGEIEERMLEFRRPDSERKISDVLAVVESTNDGVW